MGEGGRKKKKKETKSRASFAGGITVIELEKAAELAVPIINSFTRDFAS
jgi:hypothetical protein